MNADLLQKVNNTLDMAKGKIFGQDELLESIIAALVCEGHLLIEGMPGLGKTMSVSLMSRLCNLSFKRIQFTPDLLPSDLIGTMIYSQQREEFYTKLGPIFSQLLLADEINRSPAKVQSALLEAMAEKQVTIGDETHKLDSPFVVLATQNPIDQEGTYPLPEAQMDRFMMKVEVTYPSFDAEKNILDLKMENFHNVPKILNREEFHALREVVDSMYVDEKIKDYIVRLVHATRPGSKYFLKKYDGAITAGASPRAAIWLLKISKFMAFLDEKDFVSPEHIKKIAGSVLGHRMLLTYEARLDNMDSKKIARELATELV